MDTSETPGKLQPGAPTNPRPFGKYLLLGMVARGGTAEIYRAKLVDQGSPPQLLAVKCLRSQLAKEGRFVEMFIRGGELAVRLDHPTIVRTFEIGQSEGHPFIAMEYVDGKDLVQILRRCQETSRSIPVLHACYITARMAEGLSYAHLRADDEGRPLNLVNHDISPSNMRLSYRGESKLLDFGIAQAMLQFTSEIGMLKGKFSYMSPEQIRGMPIDARSDVFSLGTILHEMLTTERLFRGETEFALMEKVRRAEVPPPSKFNRRVPEALDRIVLKALAREIPDRYQSAKELADDLQAFTSSESFQLSEIGEFVQNLFRSDYQKEVGEIAACLEAKLPDDGELDTVPQGTSSSLPRPAPPTEIDVVTKRPRL